MNENTPYLATDFRAGLRVQGRVIFALIMRESQTRFGRNNLGYLWALIEPTFLLAAFWGLFYFMGREAPSGMDPVPFLVTGIVAFMALRDTANRLSNAIDANLALLLFPQVTSLDLLLGRWLLESATFVVVFFMMIFAAHVMGYSDLPDRPFYVLIAIFAIMALAFGIGVTLGTLTSLYPFLNRIFSPLWRVAMFVSGIFYTMDELPSGFQTVVAYNPIAHAIDLLRTAFFSTYTSEVASIPYLLGWILVSTFWGLLLERIFRDRLGAS